MSPSEDDEDLTLRRQRQVEAGDLLKTFPGFAKAQLETVEEINALYKREPEAVDALYRSDERTRLCIKMLDIRAAALIKILPKDNIKAHEAFIVALQATRDSLWKTWSDLPLWTMFQIGEEWREVFDHRITLWGLAGYRHVAGLPPEPKPHVKQCPAPSTEVDEMLRREFLLKTYLETVQVSEYFLYTHAKSGIHKREYRKWKAGKLPNESATTQNFERFLREKATPPPRREKL